MKKQLKYIKQSKELTQLCRPAKNVLTLNLMDKVNLYANTGNKTLLKEVQTQQTQFQSENVTLYLTRSEIDLYEFKSYWYDLVNKNILGKSDMLLFNIYFNTFLYYLFSTIFGKKYCHLFLLLWILPVTELYFLSKQNEFRLSTQEKRLYYVQEQQKKVNRKMFIIDADIVLKSLYTTNANNLLRYLDVYFKRFQTEYNINQFLNMNKFQRNIYTQFIGDLQQVLRVFYEVVSQSIDIL